MFVSFLILCFGFCSVCFFGSVFWLLLGPCVLNFGWRIQLNCAAFLSEVSEELYSQGSIGAPKARPRGFPGPPKSIPRPPRALPWLGSHPRRLWGGTFRTKWPKVTEGLLNIYVSELSAGSFGNGVSSAPQTLPSTRARGQDDVSSNKLPQIKRVDGGELLIESDQNSDFYYMGVGGL